MKLVVAIKTVKSDLISSLQKTVVASLKVQTFSPLLFELLTFQQQTQLMSLSDTLI